MGSNEDERFHPLVEASSAAMFVLERGRVTYFNPAASRLSGRTAKELHTARFLDLLAPRFRPLIDELETGCRSAHVQLLDTDGDPKWVDLHLQPLLYRGGPAILATAIEITDLKLAEISRRETEVQLKLVQRAGRTVSWDWTAATDDLVVYGLPGKLITQGAPMLATSTQALFGLMDSDDVLELKKAMRRSLRDREPLFVEISLVAPETGRKRIVLRGRPVPDAQSGRGGHIVGVATDVTRQHRVEEALVEEQKQSLELLASVSDGVVRTDLDGRIEDISPSAERLVGRPLEQIRGHLFSDAIQVLDGDGSRPLEDLVRSYLENGDDAFASQELTIVRPDGSSGPIRLHCALLRSRDASPIGVVAVLKDLIEHKKLERSMVYLATHDPLTDLLNRSEFERLLAQVLSPAGGRSSDRHVLLYLDIDDFDLINNTFGHPAADRMLKHFASFLKTRFRETDTLARLGGDKFGVLLESCALWQAREMVAEVYRDLRSFRFEWERASISVSVSTGVASLTAADTDPQKALESAEAACYLAKQKGGNDFHLFRPSELAKSERRCRAEWLQQIQAALSRDGFRLFAQRIVPLRSAPGEPAIFELLLRMLKSDNELGMPSDFIPVAERHRVMTAIDRWVVEHALDVIAETSRSGQFEDALFAINISGQSLGDDRFLEFVLNQIGYRDVDPARVCIEITETATVSAFDRATRFVSVLKGRGCRFVLDDFGTGLSSFAYLRNFPVDFIKIDGQFVKQMTNDPTHRALVEAINHVGHVMQIKTVAESVESPSVADLLRDMGVDYAQGRHFCSPSPVEQELFGPAVESV